MNGNPFADATAYDVLAAAAHAHAAREAIVSGDERLTFRTFRERVDALARGLTAIGLRKHDALAIWLPNRPLWYVAQYAAAKLGVVVVALNPRYRASELAYILGQSDAAALLLTDHLGAVDYLELLDDVLPGLRDAVPGELESSQFPHLRHVLVDADDPYPGCVRVADVLDAGDDDDAAAVHADGLFTLLYTSGTTSLPKGAMITHRNCVPHGWHCGQRLRMTPDDRVLHSLSAAGTWGGVNIPLTTWSHGACLVLMETYEPLHALSLIERERCTVWNAVDSMITPMLAHPDLDRYDRSTLRTGGFAVTGGGGHGLFEDIVTRIGVPGAYQPYGMTEVNAMALVHDLDEPLASRRLPGVIPAPELEVRIVDLDTETVCGTGEVGELQFRGPLVTPGYYQKPEDTAAAFTEEGWFRSGDLGVRDAEGRIIFKGRVR